VVVAARFRVAAGVHDGGHPTGLPVERDREDGARADEGVADVVDARLDGRVGVDAAEGLAVELRSVEVGLTHGGRHRLHHRGRRLHGVEDGGGDRGRVLGVGAAGGLVEPPDAHGVGRGMHVRGGDDQAVAVEAVAREDVGGVAHAVLEQADRVDADEGHVLAVERHHDRGHGEGIVHILRRAARLEARHPHAVEVAVAVRVVVRFVAPAARAARIGVATVELVVAVFVGVGLGDRRRDLHARGARVELPVVLQDHAVGGRGLRFGLVAGEQQRKQHSDTRIRTRG
jgi:hypothetical protein